MSTAGLKFGSLVIRTLAKPIASRIRAQAREHPSFRKVCIRIAQQVHQIDMRLRLGILRDTAAIEKADRAEKEWLKKEALKREMEKDAKYPAFFSTVSSSEPAPPPLGKHHTPGAEIAAKVVEKEALKKPPRIRPLTESKAIENGSNFISEFFLFTVAGGLILFEQIRSRRKEASRRDMVSDKLEELAGLNAGAEERLKTLEERGREDEERILALEEENWRLKGGKGEFPGREASEKKRAAEEKRLAKNPITVKVVKDKGLWRRIWRLGREEVEDDKGSDGNTLEERARKDTEPRKENPVVVPLSQLAGK